MENPLRILILEDNQADAELVRFELEDAGIVFTAKVVAKEKDFVSGLHDFAPDLILSDYDLPQYTGALALAEAKRCCPDIPFILVTGAVSEDRAIEILTSGAKDYVMKSRLSRLAPAVSRALAEAAEHRARKEAEQELRGASLYARSLIEASLDPLLTISPDGKIMDVNKATEEITGVSRDQLIGKDFADYFTEPEKARATYERAFLKGFVRDFPLALRHTSGRITNVLYNATTYANEKGEVQGVFASARDVTELKQTESALREAQRILETKVRERTKALEDEIDERRRAEEALRLIEQRQRLVFEASSLGTFEVDFRSGETHWNSIEYELLGLHPNDAPASPDMFFRFVHPDDVDRLKSQWEEAMRMGELDAEFRIVRADGEERWLAGKGKVFFERPKDGVPAEGGKAIRFMGVNFDITERKKAENESRSLMDQVKQEKERLSALINSMNDEVWFADLEKRFTLANPSALREFGLTGEDVDVETFAASLEVYRTDGSIRPVEESPALRALRGDIVKNEEEIIRTPASGELRYRQVSSSPVRDASSNIVGSVSVTRDVTERKRNERRWATTLASIGDAVIVTNTEGKITFMNAMGEKLTGWSIHEALSQPVARVFNLLNESTHRKVEDPVSRVVREGAIVGLTNHTLLVRKDGAEIPIDNSGAPIKDKTGITLGAVLVFRDITERRQVEAQINHMASFVSQSPHPVTEVDLAGIVHFMNPTAEELFPELRRLGFAHPWLAGCEQTVSQSRGADGLLQGREIKIGEKWFGQTIRFVEETQRIRIYGRSITKRKRAEAAVQASEERLRYALETSHTGVWDLCLNDHSASRSIEHDRIFGYGELLPQWTYEDFLTHVLPEDRDMVDARFQQSIKTGSEWNFDCRIRRIDGEVRWIRAAGSPREDEDGAQHLTGIIQDITERKQAEEILKDYAANLEAANRELESFSYSVSHDLRAPLRAIDGYSKMILKKQGDKFDEETKRQFKQVRDSAKAMGRLIDDLLALSRLSKQELDVTAVDIRRLAEKAWEELQNINPDRTMNLKMKPMPQGRADKALVKQVLVNILSNAIKFTKARDVAMVEMGGYEEGIENVYFVKDNGVGFDMQFHDKLFGVFQRLHDASEYEGTGVGMALAQRIIHRHKGRIWAESKVDEGATFYFTLPKNG